MRNTNVRRPIVAATLSATWRHVRALLVLLIAASILFIVLHAQAVSAQTGLSLEERRATIDALVENQEIEEAYHALRDLRQWQADAAAPDLAELQQTDFLLGLIANSTRRYTEAESALERSELAALEIYEDELDRRFELSWVRATRAHNLLSLGEYRQAARIAIAGLADREAATPEEFDLIFSDLLGITKTFINLEQWDDALRFLSSARNVLPNTDLENRGTRELIKEFFALTLQVTQELGRFEVTFGLFDLLDAAAEDLDFSLAERLNFAGFEILALMERGDNEAALALGARATNQSARVNPEDIGASNFALLHQIYGKAAMWSGEWEIARTALNRAENTYKDAFGETDLLRLETLVDRAELALLSNAAYEEFAALLREIEEKMRAEATNMATGDTDWHEVKLRQMRDLTRRAVVLVALDQSAEYKNDFTANVMAFHMAQLSHYGDTGAAIGQMAARLSAGNGAIAELIRRRTEAVDERATMSRRIVDLTSRTSNIAASEEFDALRFKLKALEDELQGINERLAREFPEFAELANPTIVDWRRISQAMHRYPSEVLLFYFVGEEASLVWAFNGGGLGVRSIPIGRQELEEKVRQLRESLDPAGLETVDDLKPFDVALSRELYDLLIKPAEGVGVLAAKHLVIIPDGPLTALPFEVLIGSGGSEAPDTNPTIEEYRDLPWLGRTHAVSVAPTVSAFVVLRETAGRSKASRPFLGIGDPLLRDHPAQNRKPEYTPLPTGPNAGWTITAQRSVGVLAEALFRDGRGNVAALRSLPSLPETADELAGISRELGAGDGSLMLRERATEAEVRGRSDLDQFRVITFATHGLTAGDLDGAVEPALVLTPPDSASAADDGLLTASEISALDLDADWVILSACNTAAPDGRPGATALSGLARAFFFAGARTLLVSHWAVVSDAASLYTQSMFAELSAKPGMARAEAARRAKLRVMDDPERPFYAHPIFWAPFSVVGDGWALN